MPTPEDIYAFLQSRRGQSLGAGDYNSLNGAYQNAYNRRAVETAPPDSFNNDFYAPPRIGPNGQQYRPWQSPYHMLSDSGGVGVATGGGASRAAAAASGWNTGSQSPQIQVDTVTGREQQKVGVDVGLAGYLTRKYATPLGPQPSITRSGDSLIVDGQLITDQLGAYAAKNNQSVDEYAKARAMQFHQTLAPYDPGTALRQAQSDPRLQSLNGLQRNAALTAAFGEDPISYAATAQKNMQATIKMQQEQQALENAGLTSQKLGIENYAASAKLFHPHATPESIVTTYGTNPDPKMAHTFKVAGGYRPDPNSPGGFVQEPDQWVWAQPEHIEAFRRSAPQGYNTPLSSTQIQAQMLATDGPKFTKMLHLASREDAYPVGPWSGVSPGFVAPKAAEPAFSSGGVRLVDGRPVYVPPDPLAGERTLMAAPKPVASMPSTDLLEFLHSQQPRTRRTF